MEYIYRLGKKYFRAMYVVACPPVKPAGY